MGNVGQLGEQGPCVVLCSLRQRPLLTKGLELGVAVVGLLVLRVLGSFRLVFDYFVALTTNSLFQGLFAEMGGFGESRDSLICNRLLRNLNPAKVFYVMLAVLHARAAPVLTELHRR